MAVRSTPILRILAAAGLTLSTLPAVAQSPAITSLLPARNAASAPPMGPVELSFTQPITAASAGGLRVFGNQRRGRRPGTLSGGGTATLRFAPAQPFAPGERVSVSAPTTLTNATGVSLRPQVYQFTAATGGAGQGIFLDSTEVAYTNSRDLLLGDIDNDGDLDLLTTAGLFGVHSFFNNGTGGFSAGAGVVMANTTSGTALADVNGDGFLDVLAGDADNPSLSIALNDGTGAFGIIGIAGQSLTVHGMVSSVATGDVDADGDLDAVTANSSSNSATVAYNTGNGFFGSTAWVGVGSQPSAVQLADIDNDGDLDLLTANRGSNSVTVRLNNGAGTFGAGPSLAVGLAPTDLTLADFDGNGSLDVLAANASNVSITLNNGGVFGSAISLALPTGSTPTSVATGDVDADGDLDFVVALGAGGQVLTFSNNGRAGFVVQAGPLVLAGAGAVATGAMLGDVDNDGDLDLLTARGGRVVLGRNGVAPVLSSFSPAAGAPGTSLTLSGSGLAGTRRITFAGAAGNVVSSGFVVNAAGTQITGVVVPAGAITGPIRATTASGTGASSASFVVNAAQLTVLQNGTSYLPAGPGYDFGNQFVATVSAAVSFTLSNPGSQPLAISGGSTTGDFAVVGAVPGTVPAGGSAVVTVVFQPTAPGARTGTLVLSSNASGFPSYVLPLRGTGVVPPPTVVSFNPASAWPGVPVTITGTNLAGATAVTFSGSANNVATSGFSANGTGTQLAGVVVPAGAVTGPVTVTTPGGTSASALFMVLPPPPPTLASVSPASVPAGATVTLTGTNLLQTSQVQFSYYPTDFTVINSTTISAVVPYGLAVSTAVVAITPGGASNALTLPLLPFLLEVNPIAGAAGTACRLTGNVGGVTSVRLNGTNATFSVSNTGIITFNVPGAATSGLVTVTSAGGTSNGLPFTVTRPLSLSSIAPTSAATGSTIVLNGSNLTGATAIVFAGGGVNTVTSGYTINAAGTQITGVVVPSGAETGLLTVVTPNGTATRTFSVTSPAAPMQPAWQTLTGATTSTNSNTFSVTTPDANGNVYVSGSYYGQLTLGSFVLPNAGSNFQTLPFIAKFNPATNTYLWVQGLPGSYCSIAAIAVNGTSVYLAGSYYDTAVFGTTTLTTSGRDVFVAKLTDTGTAPVFNWAVGGGGPGFDFITALAVQGTSLYVAGSFGDSYPMGRTYNATFGSIPLISAGQADVFVAKLTDAGSSASYTWAVRAGGLTGDAASALAVNGSSIYIGGSFFSNDAAFGPVTLHNPVTYGQIYSDAFVAKLTDAGSTARFDWAQQMGGAGMDDLSALVAQGPNIYVAGSYINSARFGGTLAVGSGTAFGGQNGYVAKLLDGGRASSFVWVQPIFTGSFGQVNTRGLAVRGQHLYVVGGSDSGARFGTATMRSVGNTLDCYLAKILDAGSTSAFAWMQQGGGSTNYDQGITVALSGSRVLVGGYLQQSASFGQLNINNLSINSYSFLASLTDATLLATLPATSGPRAALSLFPNPAHATATVQLPPMPTATTAVLTVLDALGRPHRSQTVAVPAAGRAVDLDLTGLAPGVYVVRAVAGSATLTSRLVVE